MSVDLGLVRGKGISSMTCNGNVVTVTYTDNTTGTFTIVTATWTSVSTGISGVTMYVNTAIRMVHFHIYRTGEALTEDSSKTLGTLNANTLQYKPKTMVTTACYNPDIGLAVNTSGEVIVRPIKDKSSATINAGVIWAY